MQAVCILIFVDQNMIEPIADLEPESNPDSAFLDYVAGAAPNFAPAQVALPVWDFTQAVLESARTGRLIHLGKSGA